jgi:PEP-CTERM motif
VKSIHSSALARALMAGAASLAFMMTDAVGVRADTVTGADGAPGAFCYGDPSIDEACAINGGDGESVSAGGNPAVAIGGSGGAAGDTDPGFPGLDSDGTGNGGAGGSATAVATGGSIASASATGGAGGYSDHTYGGSGGDAAATSKTFGGSDGASSSATATGGSALSPGGIGGGATATAHALATRGGLATAQATATGGEVWYEGSNEGADATSTAKSTFALANIRATDEAEEEAAYGVSGYTYTVTTSAVAQAGRSGQSFVAPDDSVYAFSTVLPDKADVATLIGDASNVADALLEPRDTIFGTAILGAFSGFASSTFDFAYRGDLLLGLIDGGGKFNVIINGVQLLAEDFLDDSVINLGSGFGPNIDLVLEGSGDFVLGGAVPEPSTWAMMLVGFAGLGFASYRSTRSRAGLPAWG